MSNRAEQMAWAKARAIEYADMGDNAQAMASLASDLRKDESTAGAVEVVTMIGFPMLMAGLLDGPGKMRKWIEGLS